MGANCYQNNENWDHAGGAVMTQHYPEPMFQRTSSPRYGEYRNLRRNVAKIKIWKEELAMISISNDLHDSSEMMFQMQEMDRIITDIDRLPEKIADSYSEHHQSSVAYFEDQFSGLYHQAQSIYNRYKLTDTSSESNYSSSAAQPLRYTSMEEMIPHQVEVGDYLYVWRPFSTKGDSPEVLHRDIYIEIVETMSHYALVRHSSLWMDHWIDLENIRLNTHVHEEHRKLPFQDGDYVCAMISCRIGLATKSKIIKKDTILRFTGFDSPLYTFTTLNESESFEVEESRLRFFQKRIRAVLTREGCEVPANADCIIDWSKDEFVSGLRVIPLNTLETCAVEALKKWWKMRPGPGKDGHYGIIEIKQEPNYKYSKYKFRIIHPTKLKVIGWSLSDKDANQSGGNPSAVLFTPDHPELTFGDFDFDGAVRALPDGGHVPQDSMTVSKPHVFIKQEHVQDSASHWLDLALFVKPRTDKPIDKGSIATADR